MDAAPDQISTADGALSLTLPPAVLELIIERVTERLSHRAGAVAEPWVGVRQAAAHLGCRPQRIYDLVSRRATSGIPHRKEGSRLLFKLSQLDRWIESGGAA